MTQKELIQRVAVLADLDEVKIFNFVKALNEILIEEVSSGYDVAIDDFGKFEIKKRSEYIMLDTETGERKLMPPSVVLDYIPVDDSFCFTLDDSLEKEMNSAFNNFEPTILNEGVELDGVEVVVVDQDTENEYVDDEVEDFVEEESGEACLLEETKKSDIDLGEEESGGLEKVTYKQCADEEKHEYIAFVDDDVISGVEGEKVDDLGHCSEELEDDVIIGDATNTVSEVDNDLGEDLDNKRVEQLGHRGGLVGKRRKNRAKSKIIIPILGGVAIALASLFFFKRDDE